MRLYDSTKTRVVPLMNFIGNDLNKLNKLFSLFKKDISISSINSEIYYGENEKKIHPAKEMLLWYVNNTDKLNYVYGFGSKNKITKQKRKLLFSGDENTKKDSIDLINVNPLVMNEWYIFEGYTHPDIYFETEDAIFIGEAKRTENKLTTKTQWLSPRDQFIRHIDSVLDSSKKIYSFYIIDECNISKYGMERYGNLDTFKESLPHRSEEECRKAMNTYIGYTTWQKITSLLGISFPNTIKD